jgi:hypothetical protein
MYYSIRVQGHLDPVWHHRFEGWQIEHEDAGTTLLSGPLPDQAALQGVLLQIIRLGLTLLSLETSQAPGREETEKSRKECSFPHEGEVLNQDQTSTNEARIREV